MVHRFFLPSTIFRPFCYSEWIHNELHNELLNCLCLMIRCIYCVPRQSKVPAPLTTRPSELFILPDEMTFWTLSNSLLPVGVSWAGLICCCEGFATSKFYFCILKIQNLFCFSNRKACHNVNGFAVIFCCCTGILSVLIYLFFCSVHVSHWSRLLSTMHV